MDRRDPGPGHAVRPCPADALACRDRRDRPRLLGAGAGLRRDARQPPAPLRVTARGRAGGDAGVARADLAHDRPARAQGGQPHRPSGSVGRRSTGPETYNLGMTDTSAKTTRDARPDQAREGGRERRPRHGPASRRAGPDEVVIEVYATGICGTDLHIQDDEFPSIPPVVMGHEVTGRVVEAGAGAEDWMGKRVSPETYFYTCDRCHGLPRRPAQPVPHPPLHRLPRQRRLRQPRQGAAAQPARGPRRRSASTPARSTSRSAAWPSACAIRLWPRPATPRWWSAPGPWASSAPRCCARRVPR